MSAFGYFELIKKIRVEVHITDFYVRWGDKVYGKIKLVHNKYEEEWFFEELPSSLDLRFYQKEEDGNTGIHYMLHTFLMNVLNRYGRKRFDSYDKYQIKLKLNPSHFENEFTMKLDELCSIKYFLTPTGKHSFH